MNKLTSEDKRALTPLIHAHINPYGLFSLDFDQRLIIEVLKKKTDMKMQDRLLGYKETV